MAGLIRQRVFDALDDLEGLGGLCDSGAGGDEQDEWLQRTATAEALAAAVIWIAGDDGGRSPATSI
jgi:hypothetical protein